MNAHAAAVERRFIRDLNDTLYSQSEIIPLADFDRRTMVPLRTARVYPTRQAAEAKIRLDGKNGSAIQEVTLSNGDKAFVVGLNYFDVTAGTLKEMRLRRLLNFLGDFFFDLRFIHESNSFRRDSSE